MCVIRSNVLSYKLGLSWGSTRLWQLLRANQRSPIRDNLFNILFVLSGRYRTAMVTRHWSPSRNGTCPVPSCHEFETIEHLLICCPYYEHTRERIRKLWLSTPNPFIHQIVVQALTGPVSDLLQFLLDASVTPSVITLSQVMGMDILRCIFHLTRTWCYALHRERLKMQGHFNFNWQLYIEYLVRT